MFLYDVIFAINVRWIFTRFSTHQTREINSTLRCVLESNAIKKKKKKNTQSASFIHHRAMYFFPSTTTLIRLSKKPLSTKPFQRIPIHLFPIYLTTNNHESQILRDPKYEQFGTLSLFFFRFKIEKKQEVSSSNFRFTRFQFRFYSNYDPNLIKIR